MSVVARLTNGLEGRYRIERELGAGGMAIVYLARDVRHDRHVALTLLRPELSAILGGERFLAEIRTTASLQHPHILPLPDSGEVDGLVYYVMPFVSEALGGTAFTSPSQPAATVATTTSGGRALRPLPVVATGV